MASEATRHPRRVARLAGHRAERMCQLFVGYVALAPSLSILLDSVCIGRVFPGGLPCLRRRIVDQRELRYRPLEALVHRGLLLDLNHATGLVADSKPLAERCFLSARVPRK